MAIPATLADGRELESFTSESFADLQLDDLLELLGSDLARRSFGAGFTRSAIDRARAWLEDYSLQLKAMLCPERRELQRAESDGLALAIAVAAVLIDEELGVSVGTVAAIVAKMGLDRLCAGEGLS